MTLATTIITTFNRMQFLRQALASVLEQTEKKIQIIVMDNSSTDGTQEFMLQIRDPRVQYNRHRAMGIAEQRNLGLNLAIGRYVGFLDDDDRWLAGKLRLQLAAFSAAPPEVALVYGGFEFYNDEGKKWGGNTQKVQSDYYNNLLWARDPFTGSASNPLLRKDAVLAVGGYNEKIKVGEDWELYVRLAKNYPFQRIEEKILEIRQHTGRRLGDQVKSALQTEVHAYRLHLDQMNARQRSRFEQRIGGKLIRLNKNKLGQKLLKCAIKNNRLNLFAWAQLVLSLFPLNIYLYFHKKYLQSFKQH